MRSRRGSGPVSMPPFDRTPQQNKPFKQRKSFATRQQEVAGIRSKFPNKIPVIIERYEKEKYLPPSDKTKFSVPHELTMTQFVTIISCVSDSENMAEAEGDHQISVEDEESPFSTKIDASKQIPAGRNVLRSVSSSFGLLCILQAALNVSSRSTSYQHLDPEDSRKNHTQSAVDHFGDQHLDPEDSGKNSTMQSAVDHVGHIFIYPTEDTVWIPTTQPAEDTHKESAAQILQSKQSFCVYGSEAEHLAVGSNKTSSRSFSQHVATFCSDIYYISSTKKTWNESRKDCSERGSDSVIINSKAEQEYSRRLNKKFWIGSTDAEQEGEWKWVDGTQSQESYWGTGEPNSFEERNEDCGEIKYLGKKNNWNDEPCYLKNHWICERKS